MPVRAQSWVISGFTYEPRSGDNGFDRGLLIYQIADPTQLEDTGRIAVDTYTIVDFQQSFSWTGGIIAGGLPYYVSDSEGLIRFDNGMAIDGNVTKQAYSTMYIAPGGFSMTAGSVLSFAGGWMDVGYAGNSPIDSIRQLVVSAYDRGAWDGPGIRLDPAASSLVGPNDTARPMGIAVMEASDVAAPAFRSGYPYNYGYLSLGTKQSMPMVLVTTAILGDTDLDGSTNYYDLPNFVAGLNGQLAGWMGGDF